mgnify:CR=1 FL=1
MKKIALALAAASLALLISACSMMGFNAPKAWQRGDGEISVVATTNVWADLAYQIGGKAITANAIIFNVNQDPHSFEATARDQLLINNADLVITNGGGFDDFMNTMLDARPVKNPVVDAVKVAGTDDTGNEHIWLDVERVRKVAGEIATQLRAIALPAAAEGIDANLAKFNSKLDAMASEIAGYRAKLDGKSVLMLDPVAHYLVTQMGLIDQTPPSALAALEEDRDISTNDLNVIEALLTTAKMHGVIVNANNWTNQISKLAGLDKNTPTLSVSELLDQDPDTFEYYGDYFDYLKSQVMNVGIGN